MMNSRAGKWLFVAMLCGGLVGSAAAHDVHWQGFIEGQYRFLGLPEGGLVQELLTDRGKRAAAGEHLLSLESGRQQAVVAGAEAALERAKAEQDNLMKGRRESEIRVIQEMLAQAVAERDLATVTLKRQKDLVETGVASIETVDAAEATFAKSSARVREVEARLETARLAARSDVISAAGAAVEEAESALAEARWRLDRRRSYAPADGLVFDVYYRVGEYVAAARPTISFLADSDRKVRFFVPETDLALIRTGVRVRVSCDSCVPGLTAVINYISPEAEFTPPVIFSEGVRYKLVFLVEAVPDMGLATLSPGLPVDVSLY